MAKNFNSILPKILELNIGGQIGNSRVIWKTLFFAEGNIKRLIFICYDGEYFKAYNNTSTGVDFWGIKKVSFKEALKRTMEKISEIQSKKLKKLL